MGVAYSPNMFQEKMSDLMTKMEFVCTYIDNVQVLTHDMWDDHLLKLDEDLHCITKAGQKVNTKKSSFVKPEVKYLGFWITCHSIKPLA